MPYQERSRKSMFFEAILVIGSLLVVGHLSVNFWEKYFIQSEITEVKTNLHDLKKTIVNIGYVYDNLNQELYELTAHSHIDISSEPTPISDKPKNKFTVDRRRNHDDKLKSIVAKWNPNNKDNTFSDTITNYNFDVTTNTNTKIAKDVSTQNLKFSVKSNKGLDEKPKITSVPNARPTVEAKVSTKTGPEKEVNASTTNKSLDENTTNTRPTVDAKVSTLSRPAIEVNTSTTDKRLDEYTNSTIATNTGPTEDAKDSTSSRPVIEVNTSSTNKRLDENTKSAFATNTRPTVDAKVSSLSRPVIEVSTMTTEKNLVPNVKSTNTRADVDTKSTYTKPDVNTVSKKTNTAEHVSTRLPLMSTVVDECSHEHCSHNRLDYLKDVECYQSARNPLKC